MKTSHVNLAFNVSSSMGSQLTFQSALWNRIGLFLSFWNILILGNQNLSGLYSDICLRYYSNDSLTVDVVRAQCMKAHQVPAILVMRLTIDVQRRSCSGMF